MYIALISHYNQYNSKWHFCVGLQRAFTKLGIKTKHFRLIGGDFAYRQLQDLQKNKPNLFCSFNGVTPAFNDQYFFDILNVPMLHLLVDQVLYFTALAKSPNAYFSAIDQLDVELMNTISKNRCFFLPHAIDDSWNNLIRQKEMEIVFFGSSIDPLSIESLWKSYGRKVYQSLMEAREYALTNPTSSTFQALQKHLLPPDEMPRRLIDHLRELEWMVRAYHRNQLLSSLQQFDLHIFGEKNVLFPGRNWKELIPKATVHKAISFKAAYKTMQKAKFTLNSSPFFPHGSHERIFMGMQAGSIVITNPSTYIQNVCQDDCLIYNVHNLPHLQAQIIQLLKNKELMEAKAQKAQHQVLSNHTWTQRAEVILERLGQII